MTPIWRTFITPSVIFFTSRALVHVTICSSAALLPHLNFWTFASEKGLSTITDVKMHAKILQFYYSELIFNGGCSLLYTEGTLTHSKKGKFWCREGEFISWRPNFSSVIGKFALINSFRVRRRVHFGLI